MRSSGYGLQVNRNVQNRYVSNRRVDKIEACLDMMDSRSIIANYFVEYNIYNYFISDINKVLKNYGIGPLSCSNISHYLHEDINRLDFYINFYGFKRGSFDIKSINELEAMALESNKLCELHYSRHLFEFENKDLHVKDFKKNLYKNIIDDFIIVKDKKEILNNFFRKNLKPFVMNINSKLVSQMVITNNGIVPEEEYLTETERFHVYLSLKKLFSKYVDKQYFKSYFKSINQMVLKRYK